MTEGRGHILVADDSQLNRTMLAASLEQQGHTVALAENGREAMDMVQAQPFDLMLLDIVMPEMDGYQVLEQMKGDSRLRDIPVIVISAVDEMESIVRCIEMGAEDYLPKPFDPVLLKARIGAGLEKKRLRDQEVEYLRNVAAVTAAAAALGDGTYDPRSLDGVAKRMDALGQLARVFQRMAGEVRAQEQLQIGRQIQAGFFPDQLPQSPGWEFAARFQPARQVAGDFYDAFPLGNKGRIGFVIADVCGKGVGAALYMALFRTLIRSSVQQHHALRWANAPSDDAVAKPPEGQAHQAVPSPDVAALKNAVELTNSYIFRNHRQALMFATLFFGVLDPADGKLLFVNGGHVPPIMVGPDGVEAHLGPTGPGIGILPSFDFGIGQTQFEPGRALVAFTDGLTEARDPDGELYTAERLHALLAQHAPSAAALLDRIEASLREFTAGADPSDDITLLAVRRA